VNRMSVQVHDIAFLKSAGFILDPTLQHEIKLSAQMLMLDESVGSGIAGDSIKAMSCTWTHIRFTRRGLSVIL
ncbi:MAG TPA: hypothetical protein VJQ48_06670, partial [Candidatus Binatia bacterium]|nr:hypothetical protein [Candidatus Binatia bacterium]